MFMMNKLNGHEGGKNGFFAVQGLTSAESHGNPCKEFPRLDLTPLTTQRWGVWVSHPERDRGTWLQLNGRHFATHEPAKAADLASLMAAEHHDHTYEPLVIL